MTGQGARRALAVILTLFLMLGVAYSVINPIFESPDESLNYANIRYLVEERRLPVLAPDAATKAHHPPAYYALSALLTSWVSNENFDAITERVNEFWIHQIDEPGVDNKTLYLHEPALERFPYRDVALGVHLVRWLSLLMGAGVLLFVHATVRELVPSRPHVAVMATSLVAFNPMFLYISASVHDDALANLVAAAILYTTARLLTRGPTTHQVMALGGLLGLALLTKLTCLLIAPTVGLGLLLRVRTKDGRPKWGSLVRSGGAILLVALLTGGWWLVRNQLLYGEPTSMGRQVEAWGGLRSNAPNLAAAVRELGFLHDSFWGVFGYGQIPMPKWAYAFPRLLGVLALGGWLLQWSRHRSQRESRALDHIGDLPSGTLLVLVSAPLVTALTVFVRMTLIDTANFGRYLFVSLGFLAPLCALGLGEWGRNSCADWTNIALVAGLIALAVFALVGVLRPAYASPPMLSPAQVQARVDSADLRFGESIRLVGENLSSHRAKPGEEVTITLCWESLAVMEQDYVYFVHLLGQEERIIGARSTHPGLGRYPTSRWSVGDRFCDVIDVNLGQASPAPAVYDVEIGWHNQGGDRLTAYAPDGSPIDLVLLDQIKVTPEQYPVVTVPQRLGVDLGGKITLLGYEADDLEVTTGETIQVTLYWEAKTPARDNYTVFLHLAAADGPPHAQHDDQPQNGTYPTSFWDVGEVVTETRTISIPAGLPSGEYPLLAGMYVLETGERLPRLGPDGTVQGDAVLLDTVTVQPGGS